MPLKTKNLPSVFFTVISLLLLCRGSVAQSSASSSFNIDARRRDMLSHLQSIIQYRRSAISNIQKAGDPNDRVYIEQADALSSRAFSDAFDWAQAEAQLLEQYKAARGDAPSPGTTEQEGLIRFEKDVDAKIKALQQQMQSLDQKSADESKTASAEKAAQKERLKASIDFLAAMRDVAQRIGETADGSNGVGLLADIHTLQNSVPELQGGVKVKPQLTVSEGASAGVVSQVQLLFSLLGTRQVLKTVAAENEKVRKQAELLRTPIAAEAFSLMQQSEPAQPAKEGSALPDMSRVKSLAADAVPLSQEIIALERSRSNLAAWDSSIHIEYRQTLSSLLTRLLFIGGALLLIAVGGELALRISHRYVRDHRRRRQFLVVRRVIVGVLSVFVLAVGFVSNFSSLTTFVGFLTAGLAVGLQTILLSTAAYFFIVGKFGLRIGDRITVASVTGVVIDVGLVRFYLMELAGSGADLKQTGRVAVFSNAVLLQSGTPLYKQLPGSEYSWRELTATLTDHIDHEGVRKAVLSEIERIYAEYRADVERQHQYVQEWLHTIIEPPVVESRILAISGEFQLWARFPIQIENAAETDEKVTQALRSLMSQHPDIREAFKSIPLLHASVKG